MAGRHRSSPSSATHPPRHRLPHGERIGNSQGGRSRRRQGLYDVRTLQKGYNRIWQDPFCTMGPGVLGRSRISGTTSAATFGAGVPGRAEGGNREPSPADYAGRRPRNRIAFGKPFGVVSLVPAGAEPPGSGRVWGYGDLRGALSPGSGGSAVWRGSLRNPTRHRMLYCVARCEGCTIGHKCAIDEGGIDGAVSDTPCEPWQPRGGAAIEEVQE